MRATAWLPCASAAAWAPPVFSSASLDRRSDDGPTCKWNLVGGVAAKERVSLPARTLRSVRRLEQQAPREFLVTRGSFEIDGLVHVVAWRVVPIGEPILENFLLRRTKLEADVHFHGGNAFLDEAVLIASNERVAQRLRIRNGFDTHRLRNRSSARAQVGFFNALNFQDFQGNDRKKHVHIDIRNDGFRRHRRMRGKIFGTEQTFLFGGNEKKENRALNFLRMRFQVRRDIHHQGAAGAVIHRAVVNAIPVDGRADADVVYVRGENDEFILEGRIGTGKFADDVGGFERLREYDCIRFERGGQRKVRKRFAVFAQGSDFREGVAGTGEKLFGGSGVECYSQLLARGFIELGVGKIHRRVIAIDGNARPGNIHGRGIHNRDSADGSGSAQRFPALSSGLVMRSQRGGNVRRR